MRPPQLQFQKRLVLRAPLQRKVGALATCLVEFDNGDAAVVALSSIGVMVVVRLPISALDTANASFVAGK